MSALLMLMSFVSFSQYVVTVGSIDNYNEMLPCDPYYNYSVSQQIYTEQEMSVRSGSIISVSFYCTDLDPTRTLSVYLQPTDLSSFSGSHSWVPVSSSSLVYSGEVSFVMDGWTTITFSEPYQYNGGSVLLTVCDNTGTYIDQMYSATFSTNNSQAIAYHSDEVSVSVDDMSNLQGSISSYKNCVKFAYNNAVPLVRNYPWTADFESGEFNTYGMTQEIISGTATWSIAINSNSGNHYVVINNTNNEFPDTNILYTPTLVRPNDASRILLTFDYLNSIWDEDFDRMQVIITDGENVTMIAEYNENHEGTTHECLDIKTNTLPEEFKIGFVGIPAYGHGFLIDNISVAVPEVKSYPWAEDFESGAFHEWMTQEIVSGDTAWLIVPSTDPHEGNYNAIIQNGSRLLSDSTILYLPDFVRPTDANRIVLSFDYVNQDWSGDFDRMQVIVNNNGNISVIAEYNEAHEEWTHEKLYIDVMSLSDRFKIGFVGIPAWGYGFSLDNIVVDKTSRDVIETNTYVQVGTGSEFSANLPVYPYYNYQYSQQIYTAMEMGRANTIYSLSFYCKSSSEFLRDVKIYMGHTDKEDFEMSEEWLPSSQLTLVYDGTFDVPSRNDWIFIPLDNPFEYNGVDNLALVVVDISGHYISTGTTFACSNTDNATTYKVYSDNDEYSIDNVNSYSGGLGYARNNVRFGITIAEKHLIEVSSSDTLKGTACCSGEYYDGQNFTITATPNFGFKFDKWNDGETDNPRSITVDGDAQYVANFIQIDTDTLRYDNDVMHTPIGNHGNSVEWGIRIPEYNLDYRPKLEDVLFYVDGQYAYGKYTLNVYQGFDTIPSQPIYTDSVTVAELTEGWISFEIRPVAVDSTQPLWIILSTEDVAYPAIASTCLDSGTDGRWWNATGSWGHQSYGAWMIKAVMPYHAPNDVEEFFVNDEISVYPNPASSQIYLQGVSEGEIIEIYNMTGRLVGMFTYNGDAIDIASYSAGLYVIRCNGITTKFIKE